MRTLFLVSLLAVPAVLAAPAPSFAKPTTIEVNSDQVIAACGQHIRLLPNGGVGCINRPCGSTTCDYICVAGGCFVTINLATNGRGAGAAAGATSALRALPALPPPSLSTPGSGMGIVHVPKGQGNGQGPNGGVP